jgi:hypothetical protein
MRSNPPCRTRGRPRTWLLATLVVAMFGAGPAPHPAPVTLVAHPWATARLNEGEPFVVPGTVLLEPGEYRLTLTRSGYRPLETTIRVSSRFPQHHVFHLEGE